MSPEEYIVGIKEKFGEQSTKDGMLIRDMNDQELMKRMFQRYPGDRDKVIGYESYLSEEEMPAEVPKPEIETRLQRLTGNLTEAFQRRGQNVAEAKGRVERGEQTLAEGLFQSVGQAAGMAGDVVLEGAKAAALGVPSQDYLGEKFNKAAEWVAETPVGQKVGEFVEEHPRAAANIGAAANIVSLPAAGAVAKPVAKVVAKVGEKALEGVEAGLGAVGTGARAVVGTPKKALSATKSWVQTPIKANVETVLKETPTEKFDQYVEIAKRATQNNKNQTPLEFAGSKAQEALNKIQIQLARTGDEKGEFLKIQGIDPYKGKGLTKFKQGIQSFRNSKTAVEGDSKLMRDVIAEANKLGETPSVGQVDKFVDFVQDRIYTGGRDLTVPVTNETTAALRKLTGELNSDLKKQLPGTYSELNSEYARLIDIRNELNAKLGAEGEKGGALMKRVFSPSDANTKKLFAEVLDETGIDLVNEATLARYMMDVLGDARQKSMLEQLNISASKPTAGSVTTRLLDYLVDKANSPEEVIRRARSLTSSGATAQP